MSHPPPYRHEVRERITPKEVEGWRQEWKQITIRFDQRQPE